MGLRKYYEKNGIVIYNNDNLELLRYIKSQSINLIYCDILYNTGKDFDYYNDNLGSPVQAIEWYRPRFEEMKRVLTSNGSIFIHCNWRLDSYIRILMDEIFGSNCFRNRIYRKHSKERGFFKNFDSQVDVILYYVKNPANFVFNELNQGNIKFVPLYENGYLEARSYSLIYKKSVIDLKLKNKHWLVTKKQFHNMAERNEIQIIEGLPYRVTRVKPIGNLWDEPDMLDDYSRIDTAEAYDTPKPEAVLDRIIKTCSNPGEVVADFFLGGGTTAVVTKKLNRKGIFCDISPTACKITVDKLKN